MAQMMIKKIFLAFSIMMLSDTIFSNGLNAINDPVMNPCIQRPYLAGCSGNNQSAGQVRQIYRVPDRWGAIYYNAANRAVGYSENNTEGEESARSEALASCIKAGGGKNPISHKGQGCHMLSEYRNSCAAIAIGGKMGEGRAAGRSGYDYVKDAEKAAIEGCEVGKPFKCTIRYSGCSRHPDYRY